MFSGNPPKNSHIPNRCVPDAFGVQRGLVSRSWRQRSEQSLEVWVSGPEKMAAGKHEQLSWLPRAQMKSDICVCNPGSVEAETDRFLELTNQSAWLN